MPLIVLSSGCIHHEAGRAPMPTVSPPEAYSVQPTQKQADDAAMEAGWWLVFNDPRLAALVESSLSGNLTVAQALERIDRATQLLQQSKALRKPQIDLLAQAERLRQREWPKNTGETTSRTDTAALLAFLAGSDPVPKQSVATEPPGQTDRYASEASSGLSFRWELDLWGRLRAESQARGQELLAAMDSYEDSRLLLSTLIVEAYYQAVEQRLQAALLEEQRTASKEILELLELRLLQGAASAVDVLQQQGQLAAIEAVVPVVKAELRVLENRLDVLAGEAPDGRYRTGDDESALPSETLLPHIGVPLDLLRQRPDLRALQRQVVAADYRIAAAMADRLPRITLDASAVYAEDAAASSLTLNGASGLLQPLLDWGQRDAAVRSARSRTREALMAYTQAYLTALEEVENALWREVRQRERIAALERREEILERTLVETRVRYGLGASDYLPVLTATQDLQGLQRDLLRERRALVSLHIELYRATGGAAAPLPQTPITEELYATAGVPPGKAAADRTGAGDAPPREQ